MARAKFNKGQRRLGRALQRLVWFSARLGMAPVDARAANARILPTLLMTFSRNPAHIIWPIKYPVVTMPIS